LRKVTGKKRTKFAMKKLRNVAQSWAANLQK